MGLSNLGTISYFSDDRARPVLFPTTVPQPRRRPCPKPFSIAGVHINQHLVNTGALALMGVIYALQRRRRRIFDQKNP
jgi:hypothetical protein